MRIKTNNNPRPILSYWELTDKHLKAVNKEYKGLDDIEDHRFVFYKGYAYLFSDFTRVNNNPWCNMSQNSPIVVGAWHGYLSESYWSGLLIKICEDSETCIIGSFTC